MLIRWTAHPAEQMVDSWRQLNRLFDEAFGARGGSNDVWGRQQWIPAADVTEDQKEFVLTLELPGIKSDEVRLDLEGNQLAISGQKRTESQEGAGARVRRIERGQRTFQRVFTLPDSVDTEHIEASLADGILTVRLPKTERSQPRQIQIRGAGSQRAPSGNGGTERERTEVAVNR